MFVVVGVRVVAFVFVSSNLDFVGVCVLVCVLPLAIAFGVVGCVCMCSCLGVCICLVGVCCRCARDWCVVGVVWLWCWFVVCRL